MDRRIARVLLLLLAAAAVVLLVSLVPSGVSGRGFGACAGTALFVLAAAAPPGSTGSPTRP